MSETLILSILGRSFAATPAQTAHDRAHTPAACHRTVRVPGRRTRPPADRGWRAALPRRAARTALGEVAALLVCVACPGSRSAHPRALASDRLRALVRSAPADAHPSRAARCGDP